jgi:cellulose biosynthesis protein BcsQ
MCHATNQMSRAIALFNQAGGVGKSTLTMNLGYHLTLLDQKVLLVDMDPQASLTVFMGLEPSELDKTVYEAFWLENRCQSTKTFTTWIWQQPTST